MYPVLTALLFSGSRNSWLSFALGIAAGLAVVLISKRLRRKEDR
jgi:O-antigen ligase